MAPGLRFERSEKGTGESCTAAEETRERTSTLLYWVQVRVVEFQPFGYENEKRVFSLSLVELLPSKARERRCSSSYLNR